MEGANRSEGAEKNRRAHPSLPSFLSRFLLSRVNIKNVNSGYLKGDAQQGWARRAAPSFSEQQQQQSADDPDVRSPSLPSSLFAHL